MKPKKNPRVDLNRDRGLFFVIGLALVLFITWRALELKSYDSVKQVLIEHQTVLDIKEEVPITETVKMAPPPPPAEPEIIEVVEDAAEIEETVIKSTETDQEAIVDVPVISAAEIEVEEPEEEITVPFAIIENIPVYPGCEEGTDEGKRICFQQKIQEHIREHFNYPPTAVEMGIQGKVYVQFVIDTDGRVTQIRTRGPDKLLEAEAVRIISALPRMIPGKQRGREVKVPYSIPINFKLM